MSSGDPGATSVSAAVDLDAAAGEVFALLSDPSRHHEFDASGQVGASDSPGPLFAAGQLFTMRIACPHPDGRVTQERTDHRVTLFAPGRALEWSVAPHGGEPLGWRWRYEVLPAGPRSCRVVLTHDWSGCPEDDRKRHSVPQFTAADLAASLALLPAALAG